MKNYYNKSTIVLISYKSEQKIYDFIKRIPKKIKIIIIENSNNIELKKRIEKKNEKIKVFIKKNEGVSSSINFAVKKIKTKYFLQISPDILFNYNDINEFIKVAIKIKDKFSALGPRFVNVKKKNHKQISKNLKIGSISSVHGSCMFINKKRFQEIGGFDENFFLYFEETDFCKRALSKGFKSYQVNYIKVKSTGRTVSVKNKKEKNLLKNILIWHFIWSKYYFTKKNCGNILSILIFFPLLMRTFFKIIFYGLTNDKKNKDKYVYRLGGLITSILGNKSSLRP